MTLLPQIVHALSAEMAMEIPHIHMREITFKVVKFNANDDNSLGSCSDSGTDDER